MFLWLIKFIKNWVAGSVVESFLSPKMLVGKSETSLKWLEIPLEALGEFCRITSTAADKIYNQLKELNSIRLCETLSPNSWVIFSLNGYHLWSLNTFWTDQTVVQFVLQLDEAALLNNLGAFLFLLLHFTAWKMNNNEYNSLFSKIKSAEHHSWYCVFY